MYFGKLIGYFVLDQQEFHFQSYPNYPSAFITK